MDELIKTNKIIIGNEEVNSVNARELWQFLEIRTQFKDWITRRIKEYEFVEDIDFTLLKNERGKNNGRFTSKDYIITLDMAKELSLLKPYTPNRGAY